ncbi:hypothetical protein MBOT_02390 [Mycobacterium botniense]|uniref:Uncharacterized protein n=1 Tax=Mycobacterium botniense TaxID=84962 RepID=A0A7I9XSF4_9MYCO|nr:hypothetical protein MBOT_02390 [Mycobacterium botniense]
MAVAAALAPVGGAARARADFLDVIIDPLLDPLQAVVAGLADGVTGVGADGGVVGAGVADAVAGAHVGAGGVDVGAGSSAAVATVASVLHDLEQQWITSRVGAEVDGGLNGLWQDLGGRGILIGNGANGVDVEWMEWKECRNGWNGMVEGEWMEGPVVAGEWDG